MKLTLTDDVQALMVQLARKGMPIVRMCWYAEVGQRTYYDWIRKGDLGQEPYASFLAAIRKAQAERVDTLLDRADAMSVDDPSMVRYLLSRAAPKQLGDEGAEEDHTTAAYAESTEEEVVEMMAADTRIQAAVLKQLAEKKLESGDE